MAGPGSKPHSRCGRGEERRSVRAGTAQQWRAVGARGEGAARAMNCQVGASSGGGLVPAGESKGRVIVAGLMAWRQHQQVSRASTGASTFKVSTLGR